MRTTAFATPGRKATLMGSPTRQHGASPWKNPYVWRADPDSGSSDTMDAQSRDALIEWGDTLGVENFNALVDHWVNTKATPDEILKHLDKDAGIAECKVAYSINNLGEMPSVPQVDLFLQ